MKDMELFINGHNTYSNTIAYDNCHKIYVIEDSDDFENAIELGYEIYEIHDVEDIEEIWYKSCPLRFIYNWKLTKTYVSQGNNNNKVLFELKG